jgi:hypothetical protein
MRECSLNPNCNTMVLEEPQHDCHADLYLIALLFWQGKIWSAFQKYFIFTVGVVVVISHMQGIYMYIPETNHLSMK